MRYLTILLGSQTCGIELSSVKEWLGYIDFTPITSPDPAAIGWFDYRGVRTTVIDLRMRFGIALTRTAWTSMVIAEIENQTFALIVDNVHGMRDSEKAPRMDEGQITPIDLIACTTRHFKIAA